MIEFTIFGEAKGKGRPRFRNMGKYVKPYTDETTTNYENLVKLSFINSGCEPYMNGEALICELSIYQSIPKSTSKKKKQQMIAHEIYPTKKPDIDNIVKSILDGLNKIAFKDDTQIIELHCYKYYGEEPRVEVTIKEVD